MCLNFVRNRMTKQNFMFMYIVTNGQIIDLQIKFILVDNKRDFNQMADVLINN